MRKMVRRVRLQEKWLRFRMKRRWDPKLGFVWDGSVSLLSRWGRLEAQCRVSAITARQETAEALLDLLCRARVTPCTFRDVLEDLAAENWETLKPEKTKNKSSQNVQTVL